MTGVLAGVRVVEFAQNAAVPHCGRLLAGMGADVVKVEPPGGDAMRGLAALAPHESKAFATINPGKRGIVLDLTREGSRAVVDRLLRWADVVLVGMKLADVERFGLDWERVRSVDPRLVLLVLTAYGPEGPDAGDGGYDVLVQARSGIGFTMNRAEDGVPAPTRPAIIDFSTGIAAALGVVAALRYRDLTGDGQRVDASLLGTAVSLGTPIVQSFERTDAEAVPALLADLRAARERGASFEDRRAMYESRALAGTGVFRVYFRCYETADGMVSVGAMSPALFARFHAATDLPRVDPGDPSSPAFMAVVDAAEALFRTRTTADWLATLRTAGVPCAPYLLPFEAVDDVQVRTNRYVEDIEHPAFGRYSASGVPLRFGAADNVASAPSPMLGQHTEDVLADIGFTATEMQALLASGVAFANTPG